MDRQELLCIHRAQAVDRPAHHIEDPAEDDVPCRHHDRFPRVLHLHAPHQSVGRVHGNRADHVVAQVQGHLNNQIVRRVIDCRVCYMECGKNRGQISFRKLHIHHRTHNLNDFAITHDLIKTSLSKEA